MTVKERKIKSYETALKRLEKCGGDCKHCEKCHMYTSESRNASYIYYAFGCDLLPKEEFSYISDTMKELHAEAVDQMQFEIKIA